MRTILHSDLNNCYASIECLRHPELRGKPVAVGGDPELRHGIVLAKSMEAKAAGVTTGESLWSARRKCPELIVLPPDFPLYISFCRMAREIYCDYTDAVEPFGLDEAWLDVGGSLGLLGTGESIAHDIRRRIVRELGVTVSVGVSFNKVFAKLGSDMKKPNAVTVIAEDNYKERVWPLPSRALLYVGRSTQAKLAKYGINTIGGIAAASPVFLHSLLGKGGDIILAYAQGRDDSPVIHSDETRLIKSIGSSTTTPRDLCCDQDAVIILSMLCDGVTRRLRECGLKCGTLQLSLRDSEMMYYQRQAKLSRPTDLTNELTRLSIELFRNSHCWGKPLRSLGVRADELVPGNECVQTSIFENEQIRLKHERLDSTLDSIRSRYGKNAVFRAVTMLDPSLSGVKPDFSSFNFLHDN